MVEEVAIRLFRSLRFHWKGLIEAGGNVGWDLLPDRPVPHRLQVIDDIIDDSMGDTVKEIAKLDGAFLIKGNGVIMSACATLRPAATDQELPQGLGARHVAAAAITAVTKSVAISLSESTGDVRVWRRGTMITEIEKSLRSGADITPPRTGD